MILELISSSFLASIDNEGATLRSQFLNHQPTIPEASVVIDAPCCSVCAPMSPFGRSGVEELKKEATGVADRVPELIRKLVYLDGFVPTDGLALMDLLSTGASDRMRAGAKANEGWRVPANPIPPDTSASDAQWIQSLRMSQPIKTFETPLRLRNGDTKIPRSYIYCKRTSPDDPFRSFAGRARSQGWDYHEIDASHSPHVTAPEALTKLLHTISSSS